MEEIIHDASINKTGIEIYEIIGISTLVKSLYTKKIKI